MRIENCKLKICRLGEAAAQVCNLQFAICTLISAISNLKFAICHLRFAIRSLQFVLAAIGLLALATGLGLTSSRADSTELFSFEQSKDRTGRGGFAHDQKEHIKVQCADCHLSAKEKPKNTDQPMAKDFPHAACIRCHNFAAEFFKSAFGQPSRFCGVCHEPRRISKADKALRSGAFPKPKLSDFEEAFSHKAHRKTLPEGFRVLPISNPPYGSQFDPGTSPRCIDCHAQTKQPMLRRRDHNNTAVSRAAPVGFIEFKTEKGHPACFVCHGGAPPEPRRVSAETLPY